MKTKKLLFKKLFFIISMGLIAIDANADYTLDVSGAFSPALTGNVQVYVEVTYIDSYIGNGLNGGFSINSNPMTTDVNSLNRMDVVAYFEDAGMGVSPATSVTPHVNNIDIYPDSGTVVKFWFLIEIPNRQFKVYAQTTSMPQPILISQNYSMFRYGADALNLGLKSWSAYRLNYERNPMTVQKVEVRAFNTPLVSGVNTVIDNSGIKLYSTGVKGEYKVETMGNKSRISVYNITGSLIKQIELNSNQEIFMLDNQGVYIVKVDSENGSKQFKLINQ